MKATTIFTTIRFGGGDAYDYPSNIPLPRVGELVSFTANDNTYHHGKVWRIWHTITNDLADIKILVQHVESIL